MISRSFPLLSVKVVSASLIESLVSTGKGRPTAGTYATLTFHLHRFYKDESFGVDCAFRRSGGRGAQCFVCGMRADLVASSAALRGVLGNRQAAREGLLRVTSINGVDRLTEATMREVLDDSHDVVVQCDVSAIAARASDRGEGDADVGGSESEAAALDTPKRRRRRPTVTVTDALDGDSDGGAGWALGKKVGGRGRHGRGASLKAPKASKKRRRYAGARSVMEEVTHRDAEFSGDGGSLPDVVEFDSDAVATAEDINAAALEALNELAPVKPVRTRGRRSTEVEEMCTAEEQSTAFQETADSAWFRPAKSTTVDEGEEVETRAADAAVPPRKRRGRPPKRAMANVPAADDAVEAPGRKRGRPTARAFEAEKQKKVPGRRGRPRKMDKTAEALDTPQPTEAIAGSGPATSDEDGAAEMEF
ncbi:hypothetical protein LSCM1_01395 [Leishmania martiniquensis]|uniref:Uncharacterized protein n=1 Tax=Leishmania martiniquensis TaxID=1580590 RepID=A0A836GAJ5_9TRYP|nr:hypothetical protein LSCM1_01395 [Leishmania martiniquensis]